MFSLCGAARGHHTQQQRNTTIIIYPRTLIVPHALRLQLERVAVPARRPVVARVAAAVAAAADVATNQTDPEVGARAAACGAAAGACQRRVRAVAAHGAAGVAPALEALAVEAVVAHLFLLLFCFCLVVFGGAGFVSFFCVCKEGCSLRERVLVLACVSVCVAVQCLQQNAVSTKPPHTH